MLFMTCVGHGFLSVHAALWSPAGKGLISWLFFCDVKLYFCHIPMWYSGSGVVLDCVIF